MKDVIDASDLISTQRSLRDRLLNFRSTIADERSRDLAAHMLLHLEEPYTCLKLGADLLLRVTDADRVDAGFATPKSSYYSPVVEVRRDGADIPSVCNVTFSAMDQGIQEVLNSYRPVAFDDILRDGRIGPNIRRQLLQIGTRRKLAVTLRDAGVPIGMLCVDRVVASGAWSQTAYAALENVANVVVGPIVAASLRLRGSSSCRATNLGVNLHAFRLTSAELKVARLVVEGHSYKEIAHHLDRSIATIDHHLRNIRDKLGVASTSKLVFALSRGMAEGEVINV